MQNESQYLQMYNQKRTLSNYTTTYAHTFAYDAVWALALALNRTDEQLKSNTSIPECQDLPGYTNITLDLLKYNNAKVACILKSNLNATNFVGVSVRALLYFNLCIYINNCFRDQYILMLMEPESFTKLVYFNTDKDKVRNIFNLLA